MRKRRSILLAIPLSLVLGSTACDGGDDDGTTDAGNGDSGQPCLEPTFTSIYFDLLSSGARCAGPGCHDSGTSAGGQDYASGKDMAHQTLLNRPTENATGMSMWPNRVVPNEPDMSFLWIKLTRDDAPDGRMPLAQPALPQCDLDAIQMWIDNGAPND